ncbi:rhomboid family intramembrane serine protease [Sandaracinus amylolyticus]|uniref:Rhomboid family serine protease n=1 Tax=Sandaracinus amylolyticus TaxID=927083 RepID=A0A0F6VYI9_9BACT|nr:rhomboid family intramembrane serine protease [Sandaracinus amylolyticus]AKF02881.1 rhomboid family serine protease [Sandaracinus amylolyticus]
MFPVRDLNPTRVFPFVTWTIIALNVVVWVFAWSLGPQGIDVFVSLLGLVPRRLIALDLSTPAGLWTLATPLTSMFMHGGWMHLLGNVWFLHVFGDNVEEHLGHARYVVFYVLAGLCAALTHVVLSPFGTLPLVGASGAIAGVLGAYMLRFPRAPILAWFVIGVVEVPAFVFLFVWFGYQLLMTWGSLGSMEQGGVAFAAHAGGFVAGLALERLLAPTREALIRERAERRHRLAESRARRVQEHRERRRWLDPD